MNVSHSHPCSSVLLVSWSTTVLILVKERRVDGEGNKAVQWWDFEFSVSVCVCVCLCLSQKVYVCVVGGGLRCGLTHTPPHRSCDHIHPCNTDHVVCPDTHAHTCTDMCQACRDQGGNGEQVCVCILCMWKGRGRGRGARSLSVWNLLVQQFVSNG